MSCRVVSCLVYYAVFVCVCAWNVRVVFCVVLCCAVSSYVGAGVGVQCVFVARVCRCGGKGCDIVQSDHAPQAGVAQGIFDGELVRRRVGHQVELEEEQDKEVERRVRRDAQRTTHRCACMDDME